MTRLLAPHLLTGLVLLLGGLYGLFVIRRNPYGDTLRWFDPVIAILFIVVGLYNIVAGLFGFTLLPNVVLSLLFAPTPGRFFLDDPDDGLRILSDERYGARDPEVVADCSPNDLMAVPYGREQHANACLFAAAKDYRAGLAYFLLSGFQRGDMYLPPEITAWAAEVMRGESRTGIEIVRAALALEGVEPR